MSRSVRAGIPAKNPEIAHRVLGGEAFLVSLPGRILHNLNPTGTRIWELIDGRRPPAQIAMLIAEEFEVAPAVALRDVKKFIAILKKKELIL